MGIDSQGVKRGACSSCDCKEYQKKNGNKCSECGHPPVKHQKLGGGVNRTGHQTSSQNVYMQKSDITCTREGCSNKVMTHPQYGPFLYCTPQCRDTDLIDNGKAQEDLKMTLHKLEENHKTAITKDGSVSKKSKRSTEVDDKMDCGTSIDFQTSPNNSPIEQSSKDKNIDNKDEQVCMTNDQQMECDDLMAVKISRQKSQSRLGLIFYKEGKRGKFLDSEHKGLLVTGFDLNIIFNSNEICLLDGIVKLEDEEVTLEGFASYYASGEIPVTVYRNKSLLGMQRQAFDVQKWNTVAKEKNKQSLCLAVVILLPSMKERKHKARLDDIIGVTLNADYKGYKVYGFQKKSAAQNYGIKHSDVIMGACILPDSGEQKPDPNWSPEGLLDKAKEETAQIMLCMIKRETM